MKMEWKDGLDMVLQPLNVISDNNSLGVHPGLMQHH